MNTNVSAFHNPTIFKNIAGMLMTIQRNSAGRRHEKTGINTKDQAVPKNASERLIRTPKTEIN